MADKDKPAERKPADKAKPDDRIARKQDDPVARQERPDEKADQERVQDANKNVDQGQEAGLPTDWINAEKTGQTLEQQAREEAQKGTPADQIAVSGHPGATAGTSGNAPPQNPMRAANAGEVAQGYKAVEEAKPREEPEPGKFKAEIKKLPDQP